MATRARDEVERSGMMLGIKDKADMRPNGMRLSAALPVIARVLRVPVGEARPGAEIAQIVPEPADAQHATADPPARGPRRAVDGEKLRGGGGCAGRDILALSVLVTSNQYVSEVAFAVRGSIEKLPGTDSLGATGALAFLNSSQEVYAIADYIRSTSAAGDVDRAVDLRRVFRAGGADWISRLRSKASPRICCTTGTAWSPSRWSRTLAS